MQKYKVKDYIQKLEEKDQLIKIVNGDEDILNIEVETLQYNSKAVIKNTMFVCKGVGNNFKKEYLDEAVSLGAICYIADEEYNENICGVIVKDAYVALNILSKLYYNSPEDKLNLIGITGTKGKSTTTYYLKYILDEYAKDNNIKETAIISSIDTYDGIEKFESHLTTPESLDMYRHFTNAKDSKIENLVMEVSSQALKVGRVYDTKFDIGVFLNISEDHISPIEHPDFDDYFNSKLKIFSRCKTACVNLDCDFNDRILNRAKSDSKEVITFSTKNNQADIYGYNIVKRGFDTVFRVRTKDYDEEFVLTMPGLFNVENALAAIAVATKLNIDKKYIYDGLKKARSSGRMEVFHTKDEKIVFVVDYAHNKLSFEKLFESTKNEYQERKIITIFGCPGKKAYLRRRDLGEVAGKNSDKIYLVAEDPGMEPVEEISLDIAQYVKKYMTNYELIEDRGEAIKAAIEYAKYEYDKTVILITGKGNETRQKYGNEYIPCISDVEYVKKYIDEYDKM